MLKDSKGSALYIFDFPLKIGLQTELLYSSMGCTRALYNLLTITKFKRFTNKPQHTITFASNCRCVVMKPQVIIKQDTKVFMKSSSIQEDTELQPTGTVIKHQLKWCLGSFQS